MHEDIAAVEGRIMGYRAPSTPRQANEEAIIEGQQSVINQTISDTEAEALAGIDFTSMTDNQIANLGAQRGISGTVYPPDEVNRILGSQITKGSTRTREAAVYYLADSRAPSEYGHMSASQQELVNEFNIVRDEVVAVRRQLMPNTHSVNVHPRVQVQPSSQWEELAGSPRVSNIGQERLSGALRDIQRNIDNWPGSFSRISNLPEKTRVKLLEPEGRVTQKIRKLNELLEDPVRTPLLTKARRAQHAKENAAEILKFAQPTERTDNNLIAALFASEGESTEKALVAASHKIDNAPKGTILQGSGSLSGDSWEGTGRMFNTKLKHGKIDVGHTGYKEISGAGFSSWILPAEVQLKGLNQVIVNINKNLPVGKKIPYGYIDGKHINLPNLTAIRKKYGGSLPIAQEGLNDNPYFGGTIPPVTIYSDPGDLEAYENKIRNLNLSNLYKLPMELGSKFSDIGKTMFVEPAVRLYDKGATQVAKDFGSIAADAAALQRFPYTKINPLTGEPYGQGLETASDLSTYLGIGAGALLKNTARKVIPKLIPKGISSRGVTDTDITTFFKEYMAKSPTAPPISPKVIDKHMNHLFGKENIDITKQKLKELGVDDIDHFKKWLKDDVVYFMGKRNRAGDFPANKLPLRYQKEPYTPGLEFTSDPNLRPPGLSDDLVLSHEFGHLLQTYINKHGRVLKMDPFVERIIKKATGKKPTQAHFRKIAGSNTQLDRDALEFISKNSKDYNRLPNKAKQHADYVFWGNTRQAAKKVNDRNKGGKSMFVSEKERAEDAALMRENTDKNNMEPLAHLREMRAGLLESGVIKSFQEAINVSKLRRYKNTLQGENDRMFSFLKNDYTTMKELKDLLNRTPIVVGTVGAGTVLNEKYQYGGEPSKEESTNIDLENISTEDALGIYRSYIEGIYDGTEDEVLAEQVYDKLNRLYYKEAKQQGMSVANYIMSNIKG